MVRAISRLLAQADPRCRQRQPVRDNGGLPMTYEFTVEFTVGLTVDSKVDTVAVVAEDALIAAGISQQASSSALPCLPLL
jgi:hypothetical protein